ncbi:MAG: PaaI family thioesterase [Sphingorhabdus sp.]
MSIPTARGDFPLPPCAKLLGFEFMEASQEEGWVRVGFTATPEFCNPAGSIQGGFLTAMLDDCMGPAILIATGAEGFPSTISLNVNFLAPAKPGPLFGEAKVVQRGKTIGFVDAELRDSAGVVVARATSNIRITQVSKAIA